MTHTTETLDKLYLEWSQFTSARTGREIKMLATLKALMDLPTNNILAMTPDERQKLWAVHDAARELLEG